MFPSVSSQRIKVIFHKEASVAWTPPHLPFPPKNVPYVMEIVGNLALHFRITLLHKMYKIYLRFGRKQENNTKRVTDMVARTIDLMVLPFNQQTAYFTNQSLPVLDYLSWKTYWFTWSLRHIGCTGHVPLAPKIYILKAAIELLKLTWLDTGISLIHSDDVKITWQVSLPAYIIAPP